MSLMHLNKQLLERSAIHIVEVQTLLEWWEDSIYI